MRGAVGQEETIQGENQQGAPEGQEETRQGDGLEIFFSRTLLEQLSLKFLKEEQND